MNFAQILFRTLHQKFPWLAGLAVYVGWLAALVILMVLILSPSEATETLKQLFTNQPSAAANQEPVPSSSPEQASPSATPSPEDTIISGLGGEETPLLQSQGAQVPPLQSPGGRVPPIQPAPSGQAAPQAPAAPSVQPQPAPSPSNPSNVLLRVKVISDQVCSGAPLTQTEPDPGATVKLGPTSVTTGADGVGRRSIDPGSYAIGGQGTVLAIHVDVTGTHDPATTADVQGPTLGYNFDAHYANGPGLSDYEVAVTFQSTSC